MVKNTYNPVASLGHLSRIYNDHQQSIRLADSKANIVLVLIGVIVSMFFRLVVSENSVQDMQIYFVLIPFIIAGFFAFLTLFPRISKKSTKGSLIYYEANEKINTKKYAQKMMNSITVDVYEDYINNIKALAKVIRQKFRYLRYAYIFLAIAVACKIFFEIIVLF